MIFILTAPLWLGGFGGVVLGLYACLWLVTGEYVPSDRKAAAAGIAAAILIGWAFLILAAWICGL